VEVSQSITLNNKIGAGNTYAKKLYIFGLIKKIFVLVFKFSDVYYQIVAQFYSSSFKYNN
jgi:hypothetical protein